MTAEKREDELTEEELKEQSGEQLPDRGGHVFDHASGSRRDRHDRAGRASFGGLVVRLGHGSIVQGLVQHIVRNAPFAGDLA
jgi:hypothetical protein